jgi:hypothetical protein
MARLHERAKAEGCSLKTLVHDADINCGNREKERAKIWAAYAEAKADLSDVLYRLADQ